MRSYLTIGLILISSFLFAQKPQGIFIDSVLKIGKPVQYAFVYTHNNNSDVIFPDSSYDFTPFNLVEIEYFPSKSVGRKSRDSVIYTLVTYEIDSLFSLSLPIKLNNLSKQKVYSDSDTILRHSSLDKIDLIAKKVKPSTSFWVVKKDFNFPSFLYYTMVFLISGLVFITLFRKTLIKQTQVYFFYSRNKQFVNEFKKLAKNYKNKANIGKALVLWKTHMERMTGKPFSSMTTKEISEKLENDRLNEALREFDATIYGGIDSNHLPFAFNILLDISTETYKSQISILKENLNKENNN